MSRSLLRTAALTATRAAQSAARRTAAKSFTRKDIDQSICIQPTFMLCAGPVTPIVDALFESGLQLGTIWRLRHRRQSTVQRVSFGRSKFNFGGQLRDPTNARFGERDQPIDGRAPLVALRLKFGATVPAILPPVLPVLATVTREMARVLATPNAGRLRDARYQPRSRR